MSAQARSTPGGEMAIILKGNFDAADAWTVHEAVQSADRRWPLVLDFTQVHAFEDFAVALLAPDLVTPTGQRIQVRGLGLHQRRLLEYFGVKSLAIDGRARADGDTVEVREARAASPRH